MKLIEPVFMGYYEMIYLPRGEEGLTVAINLWIISGNLVLSHTYQHIIFMSMSLQMSFCLLSEIVSFGIIFRYME